jgi:hypothetical protein
MAASAEMSSGSGCCEGAAADVDGEPGVGAVAAARKAWSAENSCAE